MRRRRTRALDGAFAKQHVTTHVARRLEMKLPMKVAVVSNLVTFVHRATIGNTATTDNAEVSVDRGPDFVRVTRWMMNIPPPPTYVRMGGFSGNVDISCQSQRT